MADALTRLGVCNGDILYVHSNITRYCRAQGSGGLEGVQGVLQEAAGPDGTVCVPAYNYDFCKGVPFDLANTPSQVGLFSEHLRLEDGAIRSQHPIFSHVALGKHAKALCGNTGPSGTGSGSVFERLHIFGAKLVHFGIRFYDACTYLHYVEQVVGVPYRYSKWFTGQSITPEGTREISAEFYVRAYERFQFHRPQGVTRLESDLLAAGILRYEDVDGIPVAVAGCREILDFARPKMAEAPFYLLPAQPTALV